MDTLEAGLIGAHIQKTRLPSALRLLCEEARIGFQFELIDTHQIAGFNFRQKVDELRQRNWSGVTVTHPYKTDAARYAAKHLSSRIARLGASNTLVFGPPMRGHNTDFTGFISAWRTILGELRPGRVAMAGAGGVARALAFALVELGASEVSIWDVEPGKAEQLAAECAGPCLAIPPTRAIEAIANADGLINATALGMDHAPGSAIPTHEIGPQTWAFDAVYTPTFTVFLDACRAAGLTYLTGFDLFCHMAIGSFEAYTGMQVDKSWALKRLSDLRPQD